MQKIFEVMCTRVNVFCFTWCILFYVYMNSTQKLTLYMCTHQKSRCKDLGLPTTVEWQKFIDSIKNKRFAVNGMMSVFKIFISGFKILLLHFKIEVLGENSCVKCL